MTFVRSCANFEGVEPSNFARMKTQLLVFSFIFFIFSSSFSQENYWVSTQLPGPPSIDSKYALGETCIIFAEDTSQTVHAFDINQGQWQSLLVPTQLNWTEAVADGNVALIFNDSIIAAYSALTSSYSAVNFSGNRVSTTMNPYGCIDNFAWFLTDQYLYVFDAEDSGWHSFSYTHPGEMPWGGGIYGKGDYIYMSLWVTSNSALHTLVAYSLHTKTFDEYTESNIESFQTLDHGFTFNSSIHADPYFCGGYSAFTGEIKTKTHFREIYEHDPGVWQEMVSPLICELFTTNEQIDGNDYKYYVWVFNTMTGSFAEYSFYYTYNGSDYVPVNQGCGGQTAYVMIRNVAEGDKLECLAYSALTDDFVLFNTPLFYWGSESFTPGGLFIDGYDEQNYFLYDVETGQSFTHPVQWTEGIQPGVKARGLSNYWSVFSYTEQYEDTTHIFSYSRDDDNLYSFNVPFRASTSAYRGLELYGLFLTDGGTITKTLLYAPAFSNWTEVDHNSSSYRGSEGNYFYINYTDSNQTFFYDAQTNQEYWFPSAQLASHVLARDSVFLMYSAEGKYIAYSVTAHASNEFISERFASQQWNNFIVLNAKGTFGSQTEYILYDGLNNLYAPLVLTEESGNGKTSWPGGKTALVLTHNGYLFAYYPGDVTSTEDWYDDDSYEDTSDFIVFPNPSKERIYINSHNFVQKTAIVSMYDLNGRKLLQKQIILNEKPAVVDISSLPNGVYFCHLISKNKSATQKIIIQK